MNFQSQENECLGEQRFLQSPLWERFLRSEHADVWRVNEKGISGLFVAQALPIVGKYAYSPRGPMRVQREEGRVDSGMQKVIEEARKRGCAWVRVEPNTEKELEVMRKVITDYGLRITGYDRSVQPREILCMDISASEEELLSGMKPKTRYNVRLAEKKGVKIIASREEKYQDRFIELVAETARRAGIRPHPKSHYKRMFNTFPEEAMQLYSAEYEGKVIAANMVVFYGDTAIYLHGGSSNEYRNVMAPFLLQWRAIRDAKERGCKWYDFGGVAIATADKTQVSTQMKRGQERIPNSKFQIPNSWSGITKFKQGFCPKTEPVRFPGTYDIVLSRSRYVLYRVLSRLKRSI